MNYRTLKKAVELDKELLYNARILRDLSYNKNTVDEMLFQIIKKSNTEVLSLNEQDSKEVIKFIENMFLNKQIELDKQLKNL